MILELIGTIVAAIAPAIALQLREMMKKRQAEKPLLEQGAVEKNCYMIALLCLCALAGCTKPRVSVVLIPNDRFLEPVYAEDGTLVKGRSSIADGYLREIMQDLTYCRKEANP